MPLRSEQEKQANEDQQPEGHGGQRQGDHPDEDGHPADVY
jgi:hypothetical protein